MADDADAADTLVQPTELDDALIEAADADDTEGDDEPIDPAEPGPRRHQHLWLSVTTALLIVAALGALAGWLGFRADESHQRALQREVFLQAARQGALNLTTISYTEVDTDIKRILDSSTGAFYDDFQKRSQPFVDVVKQARSKSQGTITAAGLESVQGDTAQALVGVAVTTSNAGVSEQQPRAWRMRISVQKIGDAAKVSNVEFVP
jgi:Mce-associated membrane protein